MSRGAQEALFQLVLLNICREITLKGFHNEIGHLDIKMMLDVIHNHFVWPLMAVWAKKHVEKCYQCVTFKAKEQKAMMESIVATHPLKLVHSDQHEVRKGTKENILEVMDYFTLYTQAHNPNSPLI